MWTRLRSSLCGLDLVCMDWTQSVWTGPSLCLAFCGPRPTLCRPISSPLCGLYGPTMGITTCVADYGYNNLFCVDGVISLSNKPTLSLCVVTVVWAHSVWTSITLCLTLCGLDPPCVGRAHIVWNRPSPKARLSLCKTGLHSLLEDPLCLVWPTLFSIGPGTCPIFVDLPHSL